MFRSQSLPSLSRLTEGQLQLARGVHDGKPCSGWRAEGKIQNQGIPFFNAKMLQEAVQLSELLVQGGVPHPPSTTISR